MTCTTTTTTRPPSVPALKLAVLDAEVEWLRISDSYQWAKANDYTETAERLWPEYVQAWHAYLQADQDYAMHREDV